MVNSNYAQVHINYTDEKKENEQKKSNHWHDYVSSLHIHNGRNYFTMCTESEREREEKGRKFLGLRSSSIKSTRKLKQQ